MTQRRIALVWALIIIGAAFLCTWLEAGDAATFGVISGLSGTAVGFIYSDLGCAKWCLQ
ncbi:hypothetical protein [Erythrobacter sp. YT30]|uniref:hypothetical protein n=1 Tax=Erythrobacter sp. YT30 TaxID=1735012 RepID=UPI000AB0C026|nr:hypothetical protein [Erythrobacter sp. YT30]